MTEAVAIPRRPHNISQLTWIALFVVCAQGWAGEYAVLKNGFRIPADRHEVSGDKVLLVENGGTTEMPAGDIAFFEQEEYTPPVPLKDLATAKPSPDPGLTPKQLAAAAARKQGLPAAIVLSVMKAESGNRQDAVSPKGAIGLMQLMPDTARQLGADPKVAAQNVDAGAEYLKALLAKYENNDDQVVRALAAYNAGPGAVDRYNGVPPYRETRDYIWRVVRNYEKLRKVETPGENQ